MTCPNGHPVSGGQRFCPECGAAVPVETDPATPEGNAVSAPSPSDRVTAGRPGWLLPAVGALLALVAAGVLAGVLLGDDEGAGELTTSAPPLSLSAEERALADCRSETLSAVTYLVNNNYSDAAVTELFSALGTNAPALQAAVRGFPGFQSEVFRKGRQQALDDLTTERLNAACEKALRGELR